MGYYRGTKHKIERIDWDGTADDLKRHEKVEKYENNRQIPSEPPILHVQFSLVQFKFSLLKGTTRSNGLSLISWITK